MCKYFLHANGMLYIMIHDFKQRMKLEDCYLLHSVVNSSLQLPPRCALAMSVNPAVNEKRSILYQVNVKNEEMKRVLLQIHSSQEIEKNNFIQKNVQDDMSRVSSLKPLPNIFQRKHEQEEMN